jgi:hypothetical protein
VTQAVEGIKLKAYPDQPVIDPQILIILVKVAPHIPSLQSKEVIVMF